MEENYKYELSKTEKLLVDDIVVNEKLPCSSCNGDCCGVVPFKYNQVLDIFNKYSISSKKFKKRFPWNEHQLKKHVSFRRQFPDNSDAIIIEFKDLNRYRKLNFEPTTCIFKDNEETGGCLIYEDRPLVCRMYGKRKSLTCPYAGLDEQPQDLSVRKNLVMRNLALCNQTVIANNTTFKFKLGI